MALRYPSGMTQSTLVETCRHNLKLQTTLLPQIGVTEYRTWKQLVLQGELVEEIGVRHLEAYDDSKLIVNQVRGEYEVRHENLVPYHGATINMAKEFKSFYIDHVPHQQNAHADALAALAASLALPAGVIEKVLVHNCDLYFLKFALEDSKATKKIFKLKRFSKV